MGRDRGEEAEGKRQRGRDIREMDGKRRREKQKGEDKEERQRGRNRKEKTGRRDIGAET
jgi:hypothetical protein